MSKQLVHVFEPGVSGKQILESLKSSDTEFACYSAECAPPPAGSGGSSPTGSAAAGKVLSAARKSGGGTFNPKALMRSVTSGYVVSEQPQASFSKPLKSLTESDIDSWMGKNDAILKKPGNNVGVWHDTESGQVWLDVVRVYPNTSAGKSKAISSGVKHNQIAIFHLDSMTEVNTGGSGQAVETLIAACYSKACAPPPAGSGGSKLSGKRKSVAKKLRKTEKKAERQAKEIARKLIDSVSVRTTPHPKDVLEKSRRLGEYMLGPEGFSAALIAACHSAACAPPPAGTGGSDSGGGMGYTYKGKSNVTNAMKKISDHKKSLREQQAMEAGRKARADDLPKPKYRLPPQAMLWPTQAELERNAELPLPPQPEFDDRGFRIRDYNGELINKPPPVGAIQLIRKGIKAVKKAKSKLPKPSPIATSPSPAFAPA